MQAIARTGGGHQFLVCVESRDRHLVLVHQLADRVLERSDLGIRGVLAIEVAQHHDAKVVRVVVSHVGALVVQVTAFPQAAGTINDVVIADVARPHTIQMRFADQFQSRGCRGFIRKVNRVVTFVMDGDAVDATHGVEPTLVDRIMCEENSKQADPSPGPAIVGSRALFGGAGERFKFYSLPRASAR